MAYAIERSFRITAAIDIGLPYRFHLRRIVVDYGRRVVPAAAQVFARAFDATDAIHFFLSLLICGAVAVAYPFLGVGLLTLECWYGLLAGKRLDDPQFLERSRDLLRWSDRYLLAAIGVPLVGMTLLLLQSAPVRPALLALVAAGGVGLMIAFRAHRRLREAIDTLSPLLKRDQE